MSNTDWTLRDPAVIGFLITAIIICITVIFATLLAQTCVIPDTLMGGIIFLAVITFGIGIGFVGGLRYVNSH
jgi:hypothetical protein